MRKSVSFICAYCNIQLITKRNRAIQAVYQILIALLFFATELITQRNLEYVYTPEKSGSVKFRVKAANDAHIALTNGPFNRKPITEIIIGGWNNTKSVIRRDQTEPNKAEALTPRILHRARYISFWLQWHGHKVAIGLEDQPAFLEYLDPDPHPITHFAVSTGWGATGDWKIEVSPLLFQSMKVKPITTGHLRWVTKTEEDEVPHDALIGGHENGEILYIGRALQRGSLITGKYVPSKKCLIVGWGRVLTPYFTFEILCGYNASWLKTSSDRIPPNAFEGGYELTVDDLAFIGRARVDGHLIPGKVFAPHKLCYLPYADTEIDMRSYEILVLPEKLPNAVIWGKSTNSDDHENGENSSDDGWAAVM